MLPGAATESDCGQLCGCVGRGDGRGARRRLARGAGRSLRAARAALLPRLPDGAAQRRGAAAGRVFFNTHCWDGAELATYKAEAEGVEAELDELKAGRLLIPGSQKADTLGYHLEILERSLPKGPVLEGPGNVQLAADGTIAVKANSITNLFGMLGGNAYHQIGKFSLAPLDES